MIAIIGAGGFAREVKAQMLDTYGNIKIDFFVDEQFVDKNSKSINNLDINTYEIVVAIADPVTRKRIVENLPTNTKYHTFIHKSANIFSNDIGMGSIICANSTITTNVKLGAHCHINPSTTIGHDTELGNYFTACPGVNISGNCKIGDCVYFGTNSAIKQKTKISSNVIIGMGSMVINDINESGVYVGTPSRKLK